MFRLFAYEILDEHLHAMLSWISSMEEFGFFMSVKAYFGLVISWFWSTLITSMA